MLRRKPKPWVPVQQRARWWRFWEVGQLVTAVKFWKGHAEEWRELAFKLSVHAPKPKCCLCGSENLEPDPAGYYCHAERFDGAPLLCRDHPESLEPYKRLGIQVDTRTYDPRTFRNN